MSRRRVVGVGALAAAGIACGVALLLARRAEPARCADGMTALGPRCCGEGQHLEDGRCAGRPAQCARGLDVTDAGCVARARRVPIAGGTLHVGPGDWEAQGVVTTRDAAIRAFAIDATEVTEASWRACVDARACPGVALTGEPGRPVTGVTQDEAARFCAFADGALPTPDELAFAAAGPGSRRYAWGDTGAVCRRAAWDLVDGACGRGATGPEIAGSHPDGATPEGVLDLAGNVAEWTASPPGASSSPVGDSRPGSTAEARGGSWRDASASALRSWSRKELPVGTRSTDLGFRCVQR